MKHDASSPMRSFLKAVSWETSSNVFMLGLAYLMFGNIEMCAVFSGIGFIVKLFLFYLHERLWHQTNLGKRK